MEWDAEVAAASGLPSELLGAPRTWAEMQRASRAWLSEHSQNPAERRQGLGGIADADAGPDIMLVDPDIETFIGGSDDDDTEEKQDGEVEEGEVVDVEEQGEVEGGEEEGEVVEVEEEGGN